MPPSCLLSEANTPPPPPPYPRQLVFPNICATYSNGCFSSPLSSNIKRNCPVDVFLLQQPDSHRLSRSTPCRASFNGVRNYRCRLPPSFPPSLQVNSCVTNKPRVSTPPAPPPPLPSGALYPNPSTRTQRAVIGTQKIN